MNWYQVREKFPNQWVLVDAVVAHSENNRRILDELNVLEEFEDSATALRRYKELHRTNPQNELFVLHTSREIVEIEERRWVGVRK